MRCPSIFSPIQIFNPPHRLHVNDLAKIPLRGRRMGLPHDHLSDDLYRNPGSEGESSRMAPQVVGVQLDAHQTDSLVSQVRYRTAMLGVQEKLHDAER
jgi:hypothetical protein